MDVTQAREVLENVIRNSNKLVDPANESDKHHFKSDKGHEECAMQNSVPCQNGR